jgi:hypothetical protein
VEPFFLEMDKKWTSIVIFLTTKPFIFSTIYLEINGRTEFNYIIVFC